MDVADADGWLGRKLVVLDLGTAVAGVVAVAVVEGRRRHGRHTLQRK